MQAIWHLGYGYGYADEIAKVFPSHGSFQWDRGKLGKNLAELIEGASTSRGAQCTPVKGAREIAGDCGRS